MIKLMLTSSVFVFLFSAAFFLATTSSVLQNDSVLAQEILDTQTTEDEANNEVVEEAPAAYTYEAQPGDSYTLMARKAVQTLGIVEDINLSQAQIIFVETNLTQSAGAPLLDVDEIVDIEKASVSDWAQRATELSESEEAAWAAYTAGVDFNTDGVGESS